jgi:malonyl CoA-acyl carrier protein transacylase
MGRSQREKGKRGERLAAKAVSQAIRIPARRGVQYQGGADSADLTVAIEGVHWEVKFVERESIRAWMKQAQDDSGGKIPVVLSKRSREPWLITLPLERLYEFHTRLEEAAAQTLSAVGPAELPAAVPGAGVLPAAGQAPGNAGVL